jgi:Zn-dependent protease
LIFRSIAMPELIGLALFEVAVINVVLAIFNLVPVFPLDGSRIILALLPAEFALEYEHFMHRYGIFVLLALLLPWFNGTSPLSSLIGPVIQFVARLLLA